MTKRYLSSKVTIGIPTFNRALFLPRAIESALCQTHHNVEVIISNNASSDNTKEILSGYFDDRLIILEQVENVGMVGNWNNCLQNASGDFFLLLSDDDVLEKDAIERLLSGFEHTSTFISYGTVSYIDKEGNLAKDHELYAPEVELGVEFISNMFEKKRAAYPSATLFRRLDAQKVGGYPSVGTAADLALHLMLAISGAVHFCPTPVCRYTVHSESLSYSESAILSHLNLHNWVNMKNFLPKKQRTQLQEYSLDMLYRLGRYHALRRNKQASDLALSVALRINPQVSYRLIFFLFNLAPVRLVINGLKSLIETLQKCFGS